MKIYQIHKCQGEYEYYSDVIIYSFLDKDKAEAMLQDLEKEELKLHT